MENIAFISNSIENFEFAEDYRSKGYVRNFNSHVDSLMETCSNLNEASRYEALTVNFSDTLYWSCEALVLEKLDDLNDRTILNEIDNLEDKLYSKLIQNLGPFYKNGDTNWINKMLDMTVNNILLATKFEYFSEGKYHKNPWIETQDILLENKLIYTFSDDIAHLKDLGLKINSSESKLISDKLVGVVGKGHKKNFATGYFRDLTKLRNTLYNLMESKNFDSSNPFKRELIIKEIRSMGIDDKEMSDSNIQNWLINPLKRSNRIGSNKDGYFVIKNGQDLVASYNSHLENFKGYYKTLERHRRLAEQFQVPNEILNHHNVFLQESEKNSNSDLDPEQDINDDELIN